MSSPICSKRLRSSSDILNQNDIKEWFCTARDNGIRLVPQGLLTRGGFGEIHLGIDTTQSKLVAIKTIPQALVSVANDCSSFSGGWEVSEMSSIDHQQQKEPQLTREVFQEICALRLLQGHPNIVTTLAVFPSTHLSGAISLAFPFCPLDVHASLQLRRRKSPLSLLPLGVIRSVANDMFSALQHCHTHGVLHRDVTPGNLLISYNGTIQLSDFGLSKPNTQIVSDDREKLDKQSVATTSKGLCTRFYRPPEVLLGGSSSHASVDVYSAGLVIAELVSGGQPLFPGRNDIDQLGLIFQILGTPSRSRWPDATSLPDYGKVTFAPQVPRPWVMVLPRIGELEHLEDVLTGLIALDPSQRWSAGKALQAPWFLGPRASGHQVSQHLVPLQLCNEALMMWNVDQNHAIRQAQSVALTRRSLLSINIPPWRDET